MFDRVRDLDKTILVGNIHSCVTEEILFELFLQVSSSRPSSFTCSPIHSLAKIIYLYAMLKGFLSSSQIGYCIPYFLGTFANV